MLLCFLTWCQHHGIAFVCRSVIHSPSFHHDASACFSAFGVEYSKTVRSFCRWYENANPNLSGKHFVCFIYKCLFAVTDMKTDSLILVDYVVCISVYDIFS
jgi:hypothetical protein